jgi:hypothetical protein
MNLGLRLDFLNPASIDPRAGEAHRPPVGQRLIVRPWSALGSALSPKIGFVSGPLIELVEIQRGNPPTKPTKKMLFLSK